MALTPMSLPFPTLTQETRCHTSIDLNGRCVVAEEIGDRDKNIPCDHKMEMYM